MSDPHNFYADSMGYSVPEYGSKPKPGKPNPKPNPKPKPKPGYSTREEYDDDSITDSIIGVAVDVAEAAIDELLGD